MLRLPRRKKQPQHQPRMRRNLSESMIDVTESADRPVIPEQAEVSRPVAARWPSRVATWVRSAVQFVYVRSRFLLLLIALGFVLGRWDDLRIWTDRAWDRVFGAAGAPPTISPETEYFCPMCPGVVT